MTDGRPVVLILGSGPNVTQARDWPAAWFDRIVVINNAWRVRPDWQALVYPEDFPADRMPPEVTPDQQLVDATAFVPAQNGYGGFVFAGATMTFTTAYWALAALRPRVLAFMGCDMVYPAQGRTHFYGTGTADPLRSDITLRDLGAKSARLGVIAAAQGCACVNLSLEPSSLLFPRVAPDALRGSVGQSLPDQIGLAALRDREAALDYLTPDGRYGRLEHRVNLDALDTLDRDWRALFLNRAGA